MAFPMIDTEFLQKFLTGLLNSPSPTGFAELAIAYTEQALTDYPDLTLKRTRKGALVATWLGEKSDSPHALTAHVDTLGAMVKEIKSNGRLLMTKIGGYAWNTIEGCRALLAVVIVRLNFAEILQARVCSSNETKEDDNMECAGCSTTLEKNQALGIRVKITADRVMKSQWVHPCAGVDAS
jgi:hypothetical protein